MKELKEKSGDLMRLRNFFAIMALISLTLIGFSACGDDDDDEEIYDSVEETDGEDDSSTEESDESETDVEEEDEEEEEIDYTVDVSGSIDGYDYTDLGLSVMWATCNLGASSESAYGNYYAWGEIKTKSSYSSSNSTTYGVEIGDITGNAEYDAATALWGDAWRLPTEDEVNELVDECSWTWASLDAINGYFVTGSTGNSIFLPAGGWREDDELYYDGEVGRYWSSTPYANDSVSAAFNIGFGSGNYYVGYSERYYGRSIRPVSD